MAIARDPRVSFVWGKGGAALTPEEIAKQKSLEEAIRARGIDTSPVGHWTQGAARVADAIAGAFRRGSLDEASAENDTYNQNLLSGILGGNASAAPTSSSAIPMTSAAGEVAATSPAQPIDLSGNEVYSQFINTAREGGLTNPYGLAALAATGKAESGYEPGNVNRTWSDPSQSGQPGTAGGILSWRGPRYEALAATGDLSPEGQAKFFLQEDPQLVAALNNAKSVDEAQSLINNAWKFAGYDQPGGETARRLQLARGFLPTFQGGGEVAAATPEAAIEAISPTQGGSLTDEVAAFEQTPAYTAQFPGQQPAMAAQQPTGVQQVAQALPVGGQAQPAVPGMNEALLRAISDPRATPQTRAVVEVLMQQQAAQQAQAAEQAQWMARQQYEQQQKRNDPAYQMGLDKTRLEVENLRNPRLTPSDILAREKFDLEKGQQGKTADINEYEYAKQRGYEGSFVDFQLAQKKAGAPATTINTGEGDKFYENLDKKNAETFSALSDSGMQARGKLAQIDRLEGLMANAPQGAIGALKQAAGEWGIATEGLSDIQAASALLEKMVPEQRAPGSGPMSDADIKMFRASLPRVINQPGGNQLIFQTMRGIAQYEMKMGEIADKVANRERKEDGTVYSPADGRRDIASLANPLAEFKIPQGTTPNEGWKELSPGVRVRKVD